MPKKQKKNPEKKTTPDKIFIGGPVHPEAEQKQKLAEIVRRVEKVIEKRGLAFHPHLLADPTVHKGVERSAREVKLGKTSFDKLMKAAAPRLKRLRKLRWFETQDKLARSATVGALLSEQIAASSAGVFIVPEPSPGSYLIIGELLGRQVPVLVVSDQNIFGTYLTGHPSPFLRTARYASLEDLERVVDEFLGSLEDLKLESRSVRLTAGLGKWIDQESDKAGSNFSELIIRALGEYKERREETEES